MKLARFDKIYDEVIGKLTQGLPAYLKYHCVEHTMYVVEKAEFIANKEKVSKKNIFLVKVAALYHDIGFLKGPDLHEKTSCKIAKKELKEYGFKKEEIEKICGMIMATKIPQTPKTKLENILADADLEYLSTSKYREVSELLYQELRYFNKGMNRKKWFKIQVDFISNHQYHTNYCRRYKEFRKNRNLQSMMDDYHSKG